MDDAIRQKLHIARERYEKREFEQLWKDIQKLDEQKESINMEFQQDGLNSERIVLLSKQLSDIMKQLEIKELRWLELAERD